MFSAAVKPQKTSSLRFAKAYWATFCILSRYLSVFIIKKFINKKRGATLTARTHKKTTQKIIKNILELKGLYIKIGQMLSIMTNFLPEALTSGLEQLQDSVPPHPYSEVEARFLADFKKTPREIFASFEEVPIASASLGQVHVASLPDSTRLAVKLQYPDIDDIVREDLKTLKRIFGIIDFVFPGYGIKRIYNEGARTVLQELDFISEGKNLERIRDNFKGDRKYIFPKIFWEYTGKKILTAEFIDGIKVTNVESLKKADINPHDVAVELIHFYCKQIFIDGVYHADPHPGNIIVKPLSQAEPSPTGPNVTPQIAMVDYGATAIVPPQLKAGMILFVEGLIKKDTRLLSSAMKQMGFIAREDNDEAIDKIVDYFYGKIKGIKIENFRQINLSEFQHLGDILELKKMDISLRDLTTTFIVPQDWILMERTIILMMGLVTHLDPSLNPVDIIIPYVEQFVLGKDKSATELMLQMTKEVMLSYINLPSEIGKTLKKIQEGKIVFTERGRKEQAEKLYRAVHQLIYAMFIVFTGSLACFFYTKGFGGLVEKMEWLTAFFVILLAFSFARNR